MGIVHNFLQYAARSPNGWSSYYISPVCKLMGKIWSNEAMVEYFSKGVFNWDPPFGKSTKLVEDEKPGCDFIGINYYGRQGLHCRRFCLSIILRTLMMPHSKTKSDLGSIESFLMLMKDEIVSCAVESIDLRLPLETWN